MANLWGGGGSEWEQGGLEIINLLLCRTTVQRGGTRVENHNQPPTDVELYHPPAQEMCQTVNLLTYTLRDITVPLLL